jgi:hypothetical protein
VTAVDIDDVRAAWREQRRAHERVVECFNAVAAAKGWDDENDALRALLGSLIELQDEATNSARMLMGVRIGRGEPLPELETLYPAIINVDHEEVTDNAD